MDVGVAGNTDVSVCSCEDRGSMQAAAKDTAKTATATVIARLGVGGIFKKGRLRLIPSARKGRPILSRHLWRGEVSTAYSIPIGAGSRPISTRMSRRGRNH